MKLREVLAWILAAGAAVGIVAQCVLERMTS